MDKPTDFVERYTNEFGSTTVDVAQVPQNSDPKDLLFGKPAPPPVDNEPQEEFFKWDAEKEVDGQKGAFYVDVQNNGRTERFWGRTRTEVTKNLAEGKAEANRTLAETRAANKARQPDTKLPYDPITRKQPREPNQQELLQIMELQQSDPIRAQAMAFEIRTGYTMDQVAQSVTISEQTRREIYAATVSGEFCAAHTKDFVPNQANLALVDAWLNERKLPVTRNNLEIAFLDLTENRKLAVPQAVPPAAAAPPVQEFTPPPPPVSPPARPAPGAPANPGSVVTKEEVAAIQGGSLADARSVIQNVFRRNRAAG